MSWLKYAKHTNQKQKTICIRKLNIHIIADYNWLKTTKPDDDEHHGPKYCIVRLVTLFNPYYIRVNRYNCWNRPFAICHPHFVFGSTQKFALFRPQNAKSINQIFAMCSVYRMASAFPETISTGRLRNFF